MADPQADGCEDTAPDLQDQLREHIDRAAQARDSIVRLRDIKREKEEQIIKLTEVIRSLEGRLFDTDVRNGAYLQGVWDTIELIVDRLANHDKSFGK